MNINNYYFKNIGNTRNFLKSLWMCWILVRYKLRIKSWKIQGKWIIYHQNNNYSSYHKVWKSHNERWAEFTFYILKKKVMFVFSAFLFLCLCREREFTVSILETWRKCTLEYIYRYKYRHWNIKMQINRYIHWLGSYRVFCQELLKTPPLGALYTNCFPKHFIILINQEWKT